ncbi:hypothetical protein E4T39_06072 [Aureobasidium subglaciale]|nr:hypothetical protein E4T39_06072 [Aureobasidium subglaciale]
MNILFNFLIVIFSYALYAATSTQAQALHLYRTLNALNFSDYPPLGIQLPVDHFNTSDNRTYNNRYWINGTHYQEGGPVFFCDFGEGNAHPSAVSILHEINQTISAVMEMARRLWTLNGQVRILLTFGGMAVVFEHRFYVLDDGSYQYLTTKQALKDVIYFSNHFQPPEFETS